ncbi:MAG: DEAD/DEAH box helicase family protein [Halobacteriovoraceae bacterium]|nr:DEAD/DEAH box helicase family protein [Halobacteriovoraceae bacterium]
MATGSGKTITALSAISNLYDILKKADGLPLFVIIICPYIHLLKQWVKECEKFYITPVSCFDNKSKWSKSFNDLIVNLNSGEKPFGVSIVTNSTFIRGSFQEPLLSINSQKIRTLIVCDEAHNLGAEKTRNFLPEFADYRLALSATFERKGDEEGTQFLSDYFGETCQEYGIGEAIKDGNLCEYYYEPIFIDLTDEENREYLELSKKISRYMTSNKDLDENGPAKALLIKRARLIASAKNKQSGLRDLISSYNIKFEKALIFCGDGQVELEDKKTSRQVEEVVRILGKDLGYHVTSYTSWDDLEKRNIIENSFRSGELDGIVAIRCLDEGVDLPSASLAFFLASSTNPRQFIQRRGRVLRLDPNNKNKIARIFDLIVLPEGIDESSKKFEKSLIQRELQRAFDFANHARNGNQAKLKFFEIQEKYNLFAFEEL